MFKNEGVGEPRKPFADRTCPWSLCPGEGGNQEVCLRQRRWLETELRCPGHLLPHTGKKIKLIKVKTKHHM